MQNTNPHWHTSTTHLEIGHRMNDYLTIDRRAMSKPFSQKRQKDLQCPKCHFQSHKRAIFPFPFQFIDPKDGHEDPTPTHQLSPLPSPPPPFIKLYFVPQIDNQRQKFIYQAKRGDGRWPAIAGTGQRIGGSGSESRSWTSQRIIHSFNEYVCSKCEIHSTK